MGYEIKIEPIFEEELYSTPPLMSVVVAKVNGTKQDIPKVFNLTRDLVSTADLKHLRRIKDLPNGQMECIIANLSDRNADCELQVKKLEELKEKFNENNIFTDYRVALVPSKAPKTNHQWKACSDIWPCKFAKSNYLIQCIEGSVFSDAESLVLKIIVNNLVNYVKMNEKHCSSGAIVFRYSKVYGLGLSSGEILAKNPVKHSAMMAIDSVAREAGSGHWDDSTRSDSSDLIRSIQTKLDEQELLKDHKMDADFLPYLCTNYDVFVTEEPCMMCAMGLIQSRIRRLFYLNKRQDKIEPVRELRQLCYPDGAIESFLIHRDKNLNHRFEAWRINLIPAR